MRQISALPFRRGADGRIEVLLITSRETRRWIIPKGWPERGLSDAEAAALEAWEEAGVRGRVEALPIGSYVYTKRRPCGAAEIMVSVYLLEVLEIAADWPEAHERRRVWHAPISAAEAITEPQLKAILTSL